MQNKTVSSRNKNCNYKTTKKNKDKILKVQKTQYTMLGMWPI